jgi:hypothetical protein
MLIIANTFRNTDMCVLSNDIMDYHNVAQGKITIPNVDDGEELTLTDVRRIFFNWQAIFKFFQHKGIQTTSSYTKFGFQNKSELTIQSIQFLLL